LRATPGSLSTNTSHAPRVMMKAVSASSPCVTTASPAR
jgi:hypothetical protein